MDHTLRIVILVVIAFQCALSMVIGHREAVNADGQMQISQQSKPQRRMSMVYDQFNILPRFVRNKAVLRALEEATTEKPSRAARYAETNETKKKRSKHPLCFFTALPCAHKHRLRQRRHLRDTV
ncbi:hypothetical protein AAVH_09816 [Aphelenchoides avenae]|nr:hypothetical protein AAVH_09816 [Aphelenchus avenae]